MFENIYCYHFHCLCCRLTCSESFVLLGLNGDSVCAEGEYGRRRVRVTAFTFSEHYRLFQWVWSFHGCIRSTATSMYQAKTKEKSMQEISNLINPHPIPTPGSSVRCIIWDLRKVPFWDSASQNTLDTKRSFCKILSWQFCFSKDSRIPGILVHSSLAV